MADRSFSLLVPFKEDGGIREDNWLYCWRWWNNVSSTEFQICVGRDESDPFNRSKARNNAFEQAKHDILVIADADTIINQSSLVKALTLVEEQKAPWVVPYKWYYNLAEEYCEDLKSSSSFRRPDEEAKNFRYEHKILSWAGVLVMPREAYELMGGYDERFSGWGHEDLAFRVKLDAEYGKHSRTDGSAYHIWHPIDPNQTFNTPHELANRKLFQVEYADKYNWKDERVK